MDKSIKTRTIVKDIKQLDKHTSATRIAKQASIKLKETAESTVTAQICNDEKQESGSAEGFVLHEAKRSILAKASTERYTSATKHTNETVRRKIQRSGAAQAQENTSKPNIEDTKQPRKRAPKNTSQSIKTAHTPKHSPGQATCQANPISKPATTAAKNLAQRSGYAHQNASRLTQASKLVVKSSSAFVKMAIGSARSLTAALSAVCGVALSTVVIITLVALIAVSAFGIFFTGGDLGDGNPSLREVVAQINQEHTERIDKIRAANPHDEVALTGSKTPWKEVLATFAVKTTTDPESPLDVVALDASRQRLLKDIFWDMNSLDSRVEEKEVVEIMLEEDGSGNLIEVSKTTTINILYISLSHLSIEDISRVYGFSGKQVELLHQLMDEKHEPTWQSVLYGVGRGSGSDDLVEIAASQIGNVGGAPYWSWYGFTSRVEWCACFVSWCANEAGYLEEGVVPKFSYCPTGAQWFKDAGFWEDRGFAPQPGDIIFFDWQSDGISDHVGIVESCDKSTVYTIEGNSGDACQRNSYAINSSAIYGYGASRHN